MSKNTRPNAADPRRKRIAAGDFRQSAAAFALSALSDFADQAAIQRHNFNSHRCKKSRRLCRTHILRRIQRNRRNTLPPQSRSTALPHAPALPGGGHHTPLLPLLSAEREQQKMAVLRIPLCDETAPLFLQSGVRRFRSDEDSLYEIMLADISEYRFY